MLRAHKEWEPGQWPPRSGGRPRILVENVDGSLRWAETEILEHAGYDVASCAGPEESPGPCPLVAYGRCPLAEGADVIVNGFNLARQDNLAVLRKLREAHPDTSIIVEIPQPDVERWSDALEGCRVLLFPTSATELVEEVDDAASGLVRS